MDRTTYTDNLSLTPIDATGWKAKSNAKSAKPAPVSRERAGYIVSVIMVLSGVALLACVYFGV